MIKLSKKQQQSLVRKWDQAGNGMTYLQFRRTVQYGYNCVMVHWCGMLLGIEDGTDAPDGYTHA